MFYKNKLKICFNVKAYHFGLIYKFLSRSFAIQCYTHEAHLGAQILMELSWQRLLHKTVPVSNKKERQLIRR